MAKPATIYEQKREARRLAEARAANLENGVPIGNLDTVLPRLLLEDTHPPPSVRYRTTSHRPRRVERFSIHTCERVRGALEQGPCSAREAAQRAGCHTTTAESILAQLTYQGEIECRSYTVERKSPARGYSLRVYLLPGDERPWLGHGFS